MLINYNFFRFNRPLDVLSYQYLPSNPQARRLKTTFCLSFAHNTFYNIHYLMQSIHIRICGKLNKHYRLCGVLFS